MKNHAGSGAIYGLGIIGALIYFLQNANSIWDAIIGVIWAIFWPAVVLYHVLGLLNV